MIKTNESTAYRVVVPLIQIQGHVPFGGTHQAYDRHLREGAIVPDWVPEAEIFRLLQSGLIEALA